MEIHGARDLDKNPRQEGLEAVCVPSGKRTTIENRFNIGALIIRIGFWVP